MVNTIAAMPVPTVTLKGKAANITVVTAAKALKIRVWGVGYRVWDVEIVGFLAFSLYQGLYTLLFPTPYTLPPTPTCPTPYTQYPTPGSRSASGIYQVFC